MSPRRPPRPVPTDAERQIEDLGRQLAALGARVRFQPTVAHRFGAVPAAVACLAAAGATLLGLVWPLAGVALLLLLLWAAIRDADGGRSWLRRLIPASPGWALEAELQPAPETTPTLLLWIPVPGRAHGRLGATTLARAALAVPATFGLVACMGLALLLILPAHGRLVALACAAGLALCALAAAVLLRPHRLLPAADDPSAWVPGLVARLAGQPLVGVRLLVWVGSEGAMWHDDLATMLVNRRHRFSPGRTLVVAVQPGPGPLAVAAQEGLIHLRPAPRAAVAALEGAGLPGVAARTAASRARDLGLRAIGLVGGGGPDGQGPQRLETALRCLSDAIPPSSEAPA